MKRNPLWISAAIACLIFMALLSIGAGVREVWNPEPQFNKTRSGYSTITNDLRVLPKTRQALVSFVFDEPYTEVYTVIKPIFDTAGIVGCNAVCDSGAYAVGLPGFMSWANLVTLQGSGWEILSHSSTHANLTLLTEAQVTNELTTSKSAIESRGLTVHNFVYPFGQNNEAVRRITRSYYRSGRGVGEGANTNVLSTYNLKIRQIDNPALLETYKSYVDVATTNSQWIIFYGHANLIDGTMLSNLVAFIQLTNVPIVTVNRALDLIGNDIEFGETAMSAEGFTTAKKVGIGERNPVATLEVNGNIYAAGAPSDTTFNGDIANSSVNLIGYSGVWAIRTAVNSSFNIDMLNSGSTPVKALTITKDGTVSAGTNLVTSYKIGIGTATPQSSIDLRGTYTALDGAISKAMVNIISASSAGVDKGGTLQLGGESGNGVTPYTFAAIKGAKESAVAGNYSGYMSFYTVPSASGITERVRITGSGNVGIVHTAPLAKLDVNGGVNIGATAYDPGANNLSVQGTVGVAGLIRMTNSTDVAVDPAATTGVQWQSTGGWEYRNSVASEGAGQINRVHNRAAQVIGVGTDYTLTQTLTNVVFGTSGGAITLPSAGTYVLNALANHVGGNSGDVTHWRLYDTNSIAAVPGSYQTHTIHANGDVDITPCHAIYTSTGAVVIALQGMNVTAARGTVTSTNTTISYMRCY